MKELFYIGIPEGETAPVDSLLAIIGDEGDVTALIAAESEPKQSQKLNPKIKLNYTKKQRRKTIQRL
jgi:pyruvate dehydrogenase E2 component (dihydrolipoamide acetyltransferase)